MNWNNRSLPSDDWGPLNRRKQRADREQRAYQRRLLRLRARDRRWGERSRRLREEIRAAYAVTLPVARQKYWVGLSNKLVTCKLRPWQTSWDLLDKQGLPR